MSAYVVIRIIAISDEEGFAEYRKSAGSVIADHGGKVAAAGGRRVTVEGEEDNRLVILEFPDLEKARAWYDSPEYQAALQHRLRSATAQVTIVEGA